ncbi:MAG TPA: hypothetical protein VFP84_37405 [Kofleriaceae bacterium]|nr:hypothetical protein [Kofleriaceae bacterium]
MIAATTVDDPASSSTLQTMLKTRSKNIQKLAINGYVFVERGAR